MPADKAPANVEQKDAKDTSPEAAANKNAGTALSNEGNSLARPPETASKPGAVQLPELAISGTDSIAQSTKAASQAANVKVEVASGDIAKVNADTLIAPINSEGMWYGGIDGAIQRAAGGQFHKQAGDVLDKQGLKDGDTVVAKTTNPAANKGEFGSVTFVVDDLQKPLSEVVKAGLTAADAAGAHSASIPAMRTGVMAGAVEKTPADVVAQINKGISDFLATNPKNLNDIKIVVYNNKDFQNQMSDAINANPALNGKQAEATPVAKPAEVTTAQDKVAQPGDATAKPQEINLKQITDEATLRSTIQDALKQAKEGKQVTFDVDTRVPLKGADGQPIKGATQASVLYDEMKQAYPDNAYVFSKPDLNPGDKGYAEIPAPAVTTVGTHLSTKENAITTAKEIPLADGSTLPAGSKFAVGTMMDGNTVKSADPAGKVWAQTPDGKLVQVADAGKTATLPADSISSDPKQAGQLPNQTDHIIVRTGTGTDPDGKPLLDAYPNSATEFNKNYKPGTSPDMYAAKPKSADHLKLPDNVTVQADTSYGPSTASGAKQDYFMTSGFADAKDATAKNYTGATDPRSAAEVMRIRGDLAMTEPTQVQTALEKASAPDPTPLDGIAKADVAAAAKTFKPADSVDGSTSSWDNMIKSALNDPAAYERLRESFTDPSDRDALDNMMSKVRDMDPAQRATFDKSLTDPADLKLATDPAAAESGEAGGWSTGAKIGTAVAVLALVGAAIAYAKQAHAAEAPKTKKVPFFSPSDN